MDNNSNLYKTIFLLYIKNELVLILSDKKYISKDFNGKIREAKINKNQYEEIKLNNCIFN